ncbi:MAG: hypothetical protein JNL57_06675 [Bacteroidetes bacterium]|nr:hypothetical protein [Bacteroidota bacterium]
MWVSCKKTEYLTVPGNKAPDYHSIPTIMVENYVNRVFIDLLGREATDSERNERVAYLKMRNLSLAARDTMISFLQYDTVYHTGDSSYRHACFQRIYDLSKARFLEGASDPDIAQNVGILEFSITVSRLNGDSVGVYAAKAEQDKYRNILNSRWKYRRNMISYGDMCAAMLNNAIYDQINMNSFNYVNATFDDLFQRRPTQSEFTNAYDIIDKNIPRSLFGYWAANKNEYCSVLTQCPEFYEAQIRWTYYVLLQRQATTQEVINLFGNYSRTKNLQDVQLQIMKTDEYAQFR